jgi:hypothetical protein
LPNADYFPAGDCRTALGVRANLPIWPNAGLLLSLTGEGL